MLVSALDLANSFSAQIDGRVDVDLPVYFPTDSTFAGTVLFDADLTYDSAEGAFGVSANPRAEDKNGESIELASLFKFDPAQFSLLDQLLLGVDGVDLFLEKLQDTLDGQVLGFELPLIGDKLSQAANFIGNLRDDFIVNFRHGIESLGSLPSSGEADPVTSLLFELLGPKTIESPQGLGLLLDSDDPGTDVGPGDIRYVSNIGYPSVNPKDIFLDWDFRLGGEFKTAPASASTSASRAWAWKPRVT